MLAAGEKPQARILVERAWEVLGGFLDLEPAEIEYIAAIHRGEMRSELLFPDAPDLAARVARHPAIQWKLLNVRHNLDLQRKMRP